MEVEQSIRLRPNQRVWTLEHELCCWNALQTWRALLGPDTGQIATLAWCSADALGRARAMATALIAAAPGELDAAGCECIAERVGCDVAQYRASLDNPALRRRASDPAIRGHLTMQLRNRMINQLFGPHFVRWARQQFAALGEHRSPHRDERVAYVLCYLNSRLTGNNGRYLDRLAELPRGVPVVAHEVDVDDTDDEGESETSDAAREHAARYALRDLAESGDSAAVDSEDTKHTPIRAHLFILKRFAVMDCLRGRSNYLFGGTRPATTLMRSGERADSAVLAQLGDPAGESGAMEDACERWEREAQEERVEQERAELDRQLAAERERDDRERAVALESRVASWDGVRRRVYNLWTQGLPPREVAAALHMSKKKVRGQIDAIRKELDTLDIQLAAKGAQ